jgi:hypothetical protein
MPEVMDDYEDSLKEDVVEKINKIKQTRWQKYQGKKCSLEAVYY